MRATLLGAVLVAVACGPAGEGADPLPGNRVRVVATTGMVADLARVIGAGRVEVTALMGPGVDPHLYRASAGDVKRLQEADLILYNGLRLEGKMGDLLHKLGRRRPVVAVTMGVPVARLLRPPESSGHHDPHVWFDVALGAEATRPVAEARGDRDPRHAANTDPEVVASVVAMCLEAGAGRVVVTDGSCNDPRRCFSRSGS
ncbi:MAG: metal ABC transporter solute-binding protein, Zn/Mn family, partial [Planctomycetota bacterium]